ncbi:MAG: hypothetical protein IKZ53_04005 [Selenomonadaceae bacterium]|nr:hypothetical protein [Selenomonadaceae bacterium]
MVKKILIGVLILGILGVAAFALLGYGTYKVVDEAIKEREPQLRQYLQMDTDAQNQYVLNNIEEILSKVDLDKDGKPDDKEQWEKFKQLNSQPEIQNAMINAGRSFLASIIMLSEPIVNDMTPEIKKQYENEADEFEKRCDIYSKLLKDAGLDIKEK